MFETVAISSKTFVISLIALCLALSACSQQRNEIDRAVIAYKGKDYAKAKAAFERYPDDATAQYYLARMYDEGRGVEKNASKATSLYRNAADAGNPEASLTYGRMLMDGIRTPRNPDIGLKYLEDAGQHGEPMGYSMR